MFVKSLLKYLFTWWNGDTVGTKLYTFLNGKKVGGPESDLVYILFVPTYPPMLIYAVEEFSI